jgi:hypothetical protein
MTPQQYLDWRYALRATWKTDQRFMAFISHDDQSLLYDFFDLHKDSDEAEALSHYLTVSACSDIASENARAALARLILKLRDGRVMSQTRLRVNTRLISVRSIVNADANIRRLAVGLIEKARRIQMREAKRAPRSGPLMGN